MNSYRFTIVLIMLTLLCRSGLGQVQEVETAGDPTMISPELRELMAPPAREAAEPVGVVEISISEERPEIFELIRFVDVPLARVADELGQAANANVIVSNAVEDRELTLTLRNITLSDALQAIAVSQQLISRREESGNLYVLATPNEVGRDLSVLQTTETEVFTLLYPNAGDVVRAIDNAFGDRVIVTEDDPGDDDVAQELQNRFERFDLLQARSRGLVESVGSTNIITAGQASTQATFQGQNQNIANDLARRDFNRDDLSQLTEEEARLVAEAMSGQRASMEQAQLIANRGALTFVTSIQRLNRIVVRSADPQTMKEIRELIRRLDVPTPLVLLEVRVLRVSLSDDMDTAFDFAFQAGDFQGSFTRGQIAPPAAGSVIPGGSGANFSAGLFQVVSNNFQARLELLQSKGRVTALATPILLTANNEVSQIFSGEQIPIVIGFTEPQIIVSDGGDITIPAAPVTELRNVGTDLLLTANINADRTVTLRLLQETSTVVRNGANILVPSGTGFTQEQVDTVATQSASGTVVARDGLLLAFGGLIEEGESDQRDQFPILGDLPLIGFLFRREESGIERNELIVLIRPYVLSTPIEGDQISRNLLETLSIHPYRPGKGFEDSTNDDWGVFRDEQPEFDRSFLDTFRYHTTPSLNQDASSGGTP